MIREKINIVVVSHNVFLGVNLSNFFLRHDDIELTYTGSLSLLSRMCEIEEIDSVVIDISDNSEWKEVMEFHNKHERLPLILLVSDPSVYQGNRKNMILLEKPFNLETLYESLMSLIKKRSEL